VGKYIVLKRAGINLPFLLGTKMTSPYLNYLISEIRAVPAWDAYRDDCIRNLRVVLNALICGFDSIGFKETLELIYTLLTLEQRVCLLDYKMVRTFDKLLDIALLYPPTIDWKEKVHLPGQFIYDAMPVAKISEESALQLVKNIQEMEEGDSNDVFIRISWLLYRLFPETPNNSKSIIKMFNIIVNQEALIKGPPLTLDELTSKLSRMGFK
jgi:hypothetical protein